MMGGLNFIAVLIGLFAIPEILAMVWNPTGHIGKTRSLGKNWVSFADYRKSFKSIVRGCGEKAKAQGAHGAKQCAFHMFLPGSLYGGPT